MLFINSKSNQIEIIMQAIWQKVKQIVYMNKIKITDYAIYLILIEDPITTLSTFSIRKPIQLSQLWILWYYTLKCQGNIINWQRAESSGTINNNIFSIASFSLLLSLPFLSRYHKEITAVGEHKHKNISKNYNQTYKHLSTSYSKVGVEFKPTRDLTHFKKLRWCFLYA